MTFDAINWCNTQGITLLLVSPTASLMGLFTPESSANVRLRRAQYLASVNGRDIAIAYEIIRKKLKAQLTTLQHHHELPDRTRGIALIQQGLSHFQIPTSHRSSSTLPAISTTSDLQDNPLALTSSTSSSILLSRLRVEESQAASAYFATWVGHPLHWQNASVRKTPPHYHAIRERNSPLSPKGNAQHAVDPTNTLLNYCYAVLDAECRAALLACGFDLACGFLHSSPDDPNALSHDLMELHRPAVDSLLLNFLSRTTFSASDFKPDNTGRLYIHPLLARAVVAACRIPHDQIDQSAQWLRDLLLT
jgi:CRISPR-associated endonuclease Cas1